MADVKDERQGRAAAVTSERRRRGDEEIRAARKLDVPPEVQARADAEGMSLRWVNDEGNRMHRMTVQDDWDPVEGVPPVPVGVGQDGDPIKAHLLAKRTDFVVEDRMKAEERRTATEAALTRGNVPGAQAPTDPSQATRYVVPGTKINRGNQVID